MAKWLRIKDATIRQAFEELVGLLKKGGGGEIGVDKQARAIAAEAASKAKKANDNALTAIQKAADTEAALDGKITTYYQTEPPSGDLAIGDLWFDTDDDNKPYRWDGSQWVEVRDQKVIAAYNEALDAKATADSKIVTYYQDNPPTNPSYGDLWFDTDDQNKPYRYDGSNWVEVRDQKSVEAFNLANDAKATADGKITTYYQNDAPINADYGDLWFDTDDQNKLYRYDGSNWVEVRDQKVIDAYNKALNAESIANTKITTYYQTTAPSGASEGDLWVDTDDKNRLYRWNGSAWELISDTWVQDAVNQAQYTFTDLQTDLKKGVSVVFKDISEFDANYPSAIAIGNITLNQDGTVAYGSRGVAITKNGLAGFDDSYNGAGDLPSFSIDTNGNVYLRGEIHAQSGSFAGELKSAYGTFGIITAGKLQNQEGSNYVDLNATGAADFIRINHLDHLRSDGKFRFGNGKIEWDGRTFKLVSNDDTPNELTNWNFDDNVNGWTIDTAITGSVISYEQAPSGSPDIYVYKFKNTDTANEVAIYQEVSASQGEEFTAIAYVASDTTVDYGIHFYIDFLDTNGASLGDGGATTTLASAQSFTKLVIRGTAPANTATARLKVALAANANSTDAYWYVTDIQLKRTRFGDDSVEISGSDIKFYKTLEDIPYKSLRKIEAGVANNGDTVTLTGFYDRQPYILLSLKDVQVFDSSYSTQDQTIVLYADNLNGNVLTGEWSFTAKCELAIAPGSKAVNYTLTADGCYSVFPSNYKRSLGEYFKTYIDNNYSSIDITVTCYYNNIYNTDEGKKHKGYPYVSIYGGNNGSYTLIGTYQLSSSKITTGEYKKTVSTSSKYDTIRVLVYYYYDEWVSGGYSTSYRCNYGYFYWSVGASLSVTYNYSGYTKLADGTLNWIAIG